MTNAWHRSAPEGCRKCGRIEDPHYARGLCHYCYDFEHKYGDVHRYPPLPMGQKGTDTWAFSARHATVRERHLALRARKEARLRRIWLTDGPLIPAADMRPLPAPPPLPNLRRHVGGINLPAAGATRRAA